MPKSSSVDGLIVHSADFVEGDQKKSSGHITSGKEPTRSLQMTTLREEFRKTTNEAHMKFYFPSSHSQKKFNLFIISNKPLEDYDNVLEQVKTNKYNPSEQNYLPLGVGVICHQNFKQYAASFAHRGLYIPSTIVSSTTKSDVLKRSFSVLLKYIR